MDCETRNETKQLLRFIQSSPTAFQAADTIAAALDGAGFARLDEAAPRALQKGGRYYLVRNGSAVVALRIPAAGADRFMLAASHTDSPAFQLKHNPESDAFGTYVRLNTERYGGMILSSWFDRPLSVAGRVIVREGSRFSARSVVVDRDLVLIPNVCLHFNRDINEGYRYNPACDTLPLFSSISRKGALKGIVAEAAGALPEQLAGGDLYLYSRTPGSVWGAGQEFFSAPRIDNLMCAFGALRGFLAAGEGPAVQVYAAFDNEEIGSQSRQGAGCLLLRDVLARAADALGCDLASMLARSLLVSADNAHARHPNHPELSDGENAPNLNGGVVIKRSAALHYATNGVSEALFAEICRRAGVPIQPFANRSDLPGGSTLGGILNRSVPLCTVDIGMAQLAMHSCHETAGAEDTAHLIAAAAQFYKSALSPCGDGYFELQSPGPETA